MDKPTDDTALLTKLNEAVAAANTAEKTVATAQTELVSRSRTVGLLLLEAKKLHPAVKDFEAFLKKVDGLKLSRAYDLMKLAGGRVTDEELRQESRERVQKHREKKKLPKPEPLSVTNPDVTETAKPRPKPAERATESAEISIDESKSQHARLDLNIEEDAKRSSAVYLREFSIACRNYLPRITEEADRQKARLLVADLLNGNPKAEAA